MVGCIYTLKVNNTWGLDSWGNLYDKLLGYLPWEIWSSKMSIACCLLINWCPQVQFPVNRRPKVLMHNQKFGWMSHHLRQWKFTFNMDLLDDFSGPQVEVLVNDIQKLFFWIFRCTITKDCDGNGFSNTNGIGYLSTVNSRLFTLYS